MKRLVRLRECAENLSVRKFDRKPYCQLTTYLRLKAWMQLLGVIFNTVSEKELVRRAAKMIGQQLTTQRLVASD